MIETSDRLLEWGEFARRLVVSTRVAERLGAAGGVGRSGGGAARGGWWVSVGGLG